MQQYLNEALSHPYLTTPVATLAVVNPFIVEGMPILLQVLGVVFLVVQIYYIVKNKGKK